MQHLTVQLNWEKKNNQVVELLRQFTQMADSSSSVGVAKASFDAFLKGISSGINMKDLSVQVEDPVRAESFDKLFIVSANLRGRGSAEQINELLLALEKHHKKVIIEKMNVTSSRFVAFQIKATAFYFVEQ